MLVAIIKHESRVTAAALQSQPRQMLRQSGKAYRHVPFIGGNFSAIHPVNSDYLCHATATINQPEGRFEAFCSGTIVVPGQRSVLSSGAPAYHSDNVGVPDHEARTRGSN